MYNEERKENFINSYVKESGDVDKNKKYYTSLFNKIEKFEKESGKDLCEFGKDEVIQIIQSGNRVRRSSIVNHIRIIKEYMMWCKKYDYISELYFNIFDLTEKDVDYTLIFNNFMIKSPEHLFELLLLHEDIYKGEITMATFCKLFLCLVYNGVEPKTALALDRQDVNLEEETIKLDEKIIKIYPATKYYLERVFNTNCYLSRRHLDGGYIKDLLNNGKVFNIELTDDGVAQLRAGITRLNQSYEAIGKNLISFKTRNVMNSGIFYRIYLDELKGAKIDRDLIIERFNFKRGSMKEDKYNNKINAIIKEYLKWKKYIKE